MPPIDFQSRLMAVNRLVYMHSPPALRYDQSPSFHSPPFAMRFSPRSALIALLAASYVSAGQIVSRQQSSTGDSKCFQVSCLLSISSQKIAFIFLRRPCAFKPQSTGPRSSVSGPHPRGLPKVQTRHAPSIDVLSSTGSHTLGWMAMYGIFAPWKVNSAFDIGFSGVGGTKCPERR